MSLAYKIAAIFAFLLTITILVASISWYGTANSIRKQNAIYLFSSDLKQDFYTLIYEERSYSSEKLPVHSQNVFTILQDIRTKIHNQPLTSRNIELHHLIDDISLKLDSYEQFFLLYTRYLIDLEAIKSRLYKEFQKLAAATDNLPVTNLAQTKHIHGRIIQIMLLSLHMLRSEDVTVPVKQQLQLTTEIRDSLQPLLTENSNSALQLAAFRLERSIDILHKSLEAYTQAHYQLTRQKDDLRNQLNILQKSITQYIQLQRKLVERSNLHYLFVALIITVFSAIIAIACIVYFSRQITGPLNNLKKSAQSILHGRLDTAVPVQSNDEIGQLANIFNEMTLQLQTSFSSLEGYKNHLESLVSQRTVELKKQIKEKEIAEKSLRNSQANIQQVIDQIPVGIIVWDERFRVKQWNPAAQTIFGYSFSEAEGKHASFLVPDYERNTISTIFNNITATKTEVRSKNSNLTKSGKTILCDWFNSAFLDHTDTLSGIISIVEDITEQEQKDKEHIKIAKLEAAGVLAGGIAHDFNNILTAVLGNINLALANRQLPEQTRSLLQNCEKAAFRAKSLTQQLLTFAKGGQPVKETTDLKNIIIESASFVLLGSNVSIHYDIADDIFSVDVDKGQISQVIQNIILNGRHAMPDGGVIYLKCHNYYQKNNNLVSVSQHKLVHISIQDHGIGMTKELAERIFDPYFSTKQNGSGLGLAVTHSIIQKHGGDIAVTSEPGIGTTFDIYLPASRTQKIQTTTPEATDSDSQIPWRILLMDDEEMVLDVLDQMLTIRGHTVLKSKNGEECLSIFAHCQQKGDPIDLVIMDLTIPGGMSGKQTMEEILRIQPTAKVIVASGYSNDPIISNYKNYGFLASLRKPFTSQDVYSTIQAVQGLQSPPPIL